VPSALTNQIVLLSPSRVKAITLPFGDHLGGKLSGASKAPTTTGKRLNWRLPVPSAFISQTVSIPFFLDRYAIVVPSGDHAAPVATPEPDVSLRSPVPFAERT
jgi:hypothetical protein